MKNLYFLPFFGMPSILGRFHTIHLRLSDSCAGSDAGNINAQSSIISEKDLKILFDRLPNYSGRVCVLDPGKSAMQKDVLRRLMCIREAWPNCELILMTDICASYDKDFLKKIFHNLLNSLCIRLSPAAAHMLGDVAQASSPFMDNLRFLSSLPWDEKRRRIFASAKAGEFNAPSGAEQARERFKAACGELGFTIADSPDDFEYAGHKADNKAGNTPGGWAMPVPCAVVYGFRAGVLELGANLHVMPCCRYADSEFILGNLREQSLEDIFSGEKAGFFRRNMWDMNFNALPVCGQCRAKDVKTSNMEETDRLVAWQAGKVAGQDVIFWGAGQAYRQFKGFYAGSNPVAMIIDAVSGGIREIDGIPVFGPEILLKPEFASLPIIIFCFAPGSGKILQAIAEKHRASLQGVYVCPPFYGNSENC